MMKAPFLIAVSGVKNSGKTTLITKLIPILKMYGLRVATIKHDGHDFEADVPGTDTHAHMQAGAYGTAVFSKTKYMIVKQEEAVTERELQQSGVLCRLIYTYILVPDCLEVLFKFR